MRFIDRATVAGQLDWSEAADALAAGHRGRRAEIADVFLGPPEATLLNRSGYIEGLGYGVKAVTVFDGNSQRGLATVQGAMFLFRSDDGRLAAAIDSDLITEWKTAADSVLGARLLARPNPRHLVIAGAGVVAASLVRAYCAVFPTIDTVSIWNRTSHRADAFAATQRDQGYPVQSAPDLARAVAEADIVATATMARAPILRGEWVRPGTHVDLIGAFKADMREADDTLLRKGRLFVDSRQTTIGHIGEVAIPLASGTIDETDILGDLYDLVGGARGRRGDADITVFKNGGGAHLDLMMACYIASRAGV